MNRIEGIPPVFAERMHATLGQEGFTEFINSLDLNPPVSIHLHPLKPSRYKVESASLEKVPWCQDGYYLPQRPIFTTDPGFHAGGYYVQEASSMLIEQAILLALQENNAPIVLDLCAAPGGKSTLILSLLNQKGLLVSNETIQSRIESLEHNLIKWGYPNQVLTQVDSDKFTSLKHFFDIILIDAPCSGEGLFRKDHASRKEWNENLTKECALRQRRIVKNAVLALKPGGYLIYSTCTYNSSENIEQVQFLHEQGLYSIDIPQLPEFGLVKQESNQCIGYQAYPHLIRGEGFFISLLKKPPGELDQDYAPASIDRINVPIQITQYMDISSLFCFKHHESYFMFPETLQNELETLRSKIRIVQAGIPCGTFKHKDFIPHHALSQSIRLNHTVSKISLDGKQAIDYLKGFALPNESRASGYLLATQGDYIMGWAKAIQGRYNNHYPHAYRIKGNY